MCSLDLLAGSVPPSAVAIPPPPVSEDGGVPRVFVETLKTACNVWTAACFIRKVPGGLVPTTYPLQCVLNGEVSPEDQQAIVDHANEVAARLRFFHGRLEFPQVFLCDRMKQESLAS